MGESGRFPLGGVWDPPLKCEYKRYQCGRNAARDSYLDGRYPSVIRPPSGLSRDVSHTVRYLPTWPPRAVTEHHSESQRVRVSRGDVLHVIALRKASFMVVWGSTVP